MALTKVNTDLLEDGGKLDGIEAGADVTDTTNVTAAGALMDSELTSIASVKALNQGVATTDSPTFAGLTSTGEITANGGIALADGDVATFGDSDDLSIQHLGGNTYLTNTTGSLILRSDSFRVLNTANSEQILHGDANGAVTAYYDNSVKLATTSTGIDVTGNLTMASGGSIVAGGANDLILNAGESGTPDIYLQSGSSTKVKIEGSNGDLVKVGGVIKGERGTASAPAYSFSDDTDTGMFNIANADLGFAVGGTERMRIDSAGRVLIGKPAANTGFPIELQATSAGQGLGLYGRASDGFSFLGFYATGSNTQYARISSSNTNSLTFDTNATERMRIDASGNLLVGKTTTAIGTQGIRLEGNNGKIEATRSGNVVTAFNRTGSDGTISEWMKDGTTVGSIGTNVGRLSIGSGDTGVLFAGDIDAIYPANGIAARDSAIDLGVSGARFKDLYLSGKVQASYIYRADASGAGLHFTTNAIYPTNETAALSDGTESLGAAAYRFKDLYITGLDVTYSTYNKISSYFSGSYISGFKFSDLNGGIWYDAATDDLTVSASHANSQLILESGGSESMRIDASGRLLVGYTAADGVGGAPSDNNFSELGKGYINLNRDDTATARQVQFGKNGVVAGYIQTAGSTTSYVTSSDQRLKENIADADDAGSKVDAIQVRKYDWKADGSHQDYGMIAQELQAVAPEAVSGDADSEEMMGVDYSKLVPMLIKEIQSLRNRVAQLEE